MYYSLETLEEKLMHLKIHLWDLQQEQDEKRNKAMAYVLEHLNMIAQSALVQLHEQEEEIAKKTPARVQ